VCFFILVSFFGYCECILCFVVLCPVVTNRHGVDDVDGDDNDLCSVAKHRPIKRLEAAHVNFSTQDIGSQVER